MKTAKKRVLEQNKDLFCIITYADVFAGERSRFAALAALQRLHRPYAALMYAK